VFVSRSTRKNNKENLYDQNPDIELHDVLGTIGKHPKILNPKILNFM